MTRDPLKIAVVIAAMIVIAALIARCAEEDGYARPRPCVAIVTAYAHLDDDGAVDIIRLAPTFGKGCPASMRLRLKVTVRTPPRGPVRKLPQICYWPISERPL